MVPLLFIFQGDDIPEHELPHPFNQTKSSVAQITPRAGPEAASAVPSSSLTEQQPVAMSHLSHSFKRRFLQRSSACPATASRTSPLAKVESTAPSPLSRKQLLSSIVSGSLSIDDEAQVQDKCGKDVVFKSGMLVWMKRTKAWVRLQSMAMMSYSVFFRSPSCNR